MDSKIQRILMQFKQLVRKTNRERINPMIQELAIDDLKPLVDLVARSRAEYLRELYNLSKKCADSDALPSAEEFKKLRTYRKRFIELSDGAQSFETSIERGYLDIKN